MTGSLRGCEEVKGMTITYVCLVLMYDSTITTLTDLGSFFYCVISTVLGDS